MKILVLGHSNMVGHVVSMWFSEQGHIVHGYDECRLEAIESKLEKCIQGKLDDYDLLRQLLSCDSYDAVINCTAVINQEAENYKVKAIKVNSLLPHFLEEITKDTSTVVVHRSTDCIFSGEKGKYDLRDWPDRDTFYGRSKALGELENDKDITIRLSLIGPETDANGSGLFNWFYNQESEVSGFANAIWTGLTTIEFAREIEWLLTNDCHGIFQLVPDKSISKYELLRLFEEYYPKKRAISRIDNDRVDRSLIQIKPIGLNIPDYRYMIAEMRKWTDKYNHIYNY